MREIQQANPSRQAAFLPSLRDVPLLLILAAAYYYSGKLGLRFASIHPSATAVWAPTGIAIASFLLFGKRVWPAIFLGAFLVNLTTFGTVLSSLGIAAGNMLEGWAGAYLANAFANGRKAFERTEDVFRFAFFSGLLSTTVSATIGVTTLALAGLAPWNRYLPIWSTWWLGDISGALIVTPLLLSWAAPSRMRWNWSRAVEAVLLIACILAIGQLRFAAPISESLSHMPFGFLVLPLLLWPAIRFTQREVATSVFILSTMATWGAVQGLGPFQLGTRNEGLLLLQLFMASISITALATNAAFSERGKAAERFQTVIDSAPSAMVMVNERGKIVLVNSAAQELFGYRGEELIGQAIEMLVPGRFRDAHPEYRAGFVSDPRARPMGAGRDLYAVRKDGSEFPVEIGLNPVETEEGLRVLGAVVDLSERKRTEEALRHAKDDLEAQVAQRTEALRASRQSLRQLSARILHLQDDERRRIARELHDSTGQKLAAMNMNLTLAAREGAGLSERARQALTDSSALAQQVVGEIRTLSYLLHPPLLEELGLGATLRWYVEGFGQRSGIRVRLEVPEDWPGAPHEVSLTLFRVVQESLTNIHRHSQSATAQVRLSADDKELLLEVEDQGCGIPREVLESEGVQSLGVGIRGMRERVSQLNGSLEVDSKAGGTTVRVRLPLPTTAPQREQAQSA